MALKNYSLEYSPIPRDKNRYKLSLACSEKDVNELVKKLSSISSRPFSATDKNFEWSFFLYDLKDNIKDKLKSELDKAVSAKANIEKPDAEKESTKEKPEEFKSIRLNPDYLFDNFVVGASTRFTYAACKSVAESPGKNYNPLFIYGGVGLGKTHLMHAIGNHIKQKFPDYTVVYITTGEFVHEVIDAIEKGTINNIREKYKKIDLLLIDDIQFLERSESTQEEFFHIFNDMYEVAKQIVITSDKPPKKLMTLEDRLKSRFEWGLTTDIKSPNSETRKAIINKKSMKVGIEISEEIVDYIAERLTSNIRELEGIINRIYAYQQLSEDKITIDFIKEIIRSILPSDETEEGKEPSKKEKKTQKINQQDNPLQQQAYPSHPPPPPHPIPQYAPPQPMMNVCQRCGGQLTFIPQYQKWYCTNCGMYVEQIKSFVPPFSQPQSFGMPAPSDAEKRCTKCNMPLMYVSEYNRFYCNNCREYANEETSVLPVPSNNVVSSNEETVVIEEKNTEPKKIAEPSPKKEASKEDFKDKVIGKEKENIREIKTGYFLPEGTDDIFNNIVNKLHKLATQKKFNFYIKPLFTHFYSNDANINYDKIAHMAKTNGIDISLCLRPSSESGVSGEEFKKKLTEAMDKEKMPFEILLQEEMKESDALNFMLDIAICARKNENI